MEETAARRVARSVGRFVYAAAFFCGCALLCLFLLDSLYAWLTAQGTPTIPADIPGVGGMPVALALGSAASLTFLLANGKVVLGTLAGLVGYVRAGSNYNFLKEGVTLVATLLLVLLSARFFLDEPFPIPAPAPTPAPPAAEHKPMELVTHFKFKLEPRAEILAAFPMTFSNALVRDGLTQLPLVAPDDMGGIFERGVESGIDPRPEHVVAIRQLVAAFEPCAGLGAAENVVLRVRGYASSTPFEGFTAAGSKRLNLWAANARAEGIRKTLHSQLTATDYEDRVRVIYEPHPTFAAMNGSRPYNDRPPGSEEGNPSELFNRSVLVELVSAGKCGLSYTGPYDPAHK